MIRIGMQFFGGRGGSSGGGGGGGRAGTRAVQEVLGMSPNQAAANYWDILRFANSPNEKYRQVEAAANGEMLGYHMYDVIRTQAGDNNPDLVSGRGRNRTWSANYQEVLQDRLGESGISALKSAIQAEAKKWLKNHPRPANPRRNGYRWDGTKYVKP